VRHEKVAEDIIDELVVDPFLTDAVGDLSNQGFVLDKRLGRHQIYSVHWYIGLEWCHLTLPKASKTA
jgi:hypothetical protein